MQLSIGGASVGVLDHFPPSPLLATMFGMASDTSPEQLVRHAELVRAMTPEQRGQALRAVDRGLRRIVLARLRARHPGETDRELIARHVAQLYGPDAARNLYGRLPGDIGQ